MPDPVHDAAERPSGPSSMSAAEKLACEWEARHDVASRGRQVDPAAALQHYLSHSRCEEGSPHQHHPAPSSGASAGRRARRTDPFAAQHPLMASWVRWGEDSR
jgi:hypothetical protein